MSTLPTPDDDTVAQSRRAIRKVERDENARAADRLKMARHGCLIVAPGRW